MKLQIEMTKDEFEETLLNEFGYDSEQMEVSGLYMWLDGGIEFTISEKVKEPEVIPHGAGAGYAGPVEEQRPQLWCPEPPFIHTTEVNQPERKRGDYYPPIDTTKPLGASTTCHCKTYGAFEGYGWVDYDMNLHLPEHCEGENEPPAADATAVLSASTTGEHGTVDPSDDTLF